MVSLLQQMMVPSLQQMGPFLATRTETRFSLRRRQQVLSWGLCEIWASIRSSPTLGQLEPSILKLNSLEQIQGACFACCHGHHVVQKKLRILHSELKTAKNCWVRVHTNMSFLCKKKCVSIKNWVEVSDKRSTNMCSECPQQRRQKRVGLELPSRSFVYCTTQVVPGCLPLAFLFRILQCCFIQSVSLSLHNKPLALVPSFTMFLRHWSSWRVLISTLSRSCQSLQQDEWVDVGVDHPVHCQEEYGTSWELLLVQCSLAFEHLFVEFSLHMVMEAPWKLQTAVNYSTDEPLADSLLFDGDEPCAGLVTWVHISLDLTWAQL